MLRTTKNMKDKYEKIQQYLFSMIPEKWEEIYLYASVVTNLKNGQTGEMYFYYLPKGILKKKPINVYEIPRRFNINEEQYMKLVEKLYDCFKGLKQDFIDTEQDLWTSLTISIANSKFKVEYNYDSLPLNEQESNERHVIWRYEYLGIGGEKKEERKILDDYFSRNKKVKKNVYEIGLYVKTDINFVTFDKEDSKEPREIIVYEKEDASTQDEEDFISKSEKSNFGFKKKNDNNDDDGDNQIKNQILNM